MNAVEPVGCLLSSPLKTRISKNLTGTEACMREEREQETGISRLPPRLLRGYCIGGVLERNVFLTEWICINRFHLCILCLPVPSSFHICCVHVRVHTQHPCVIVSASEMMRLGLSGLSIWMKTETRIRLTVGRGSPERGRSPTRTRRSSRSQRRALV